MSAPRYSQYLGGPKVVSTKSRSLIYPALHQWLPFMTWEGFFRSYSRPLCFPSPETPRPALVHALEWPLTPPWRPIVQRDFKKYYLYSNHGYCLDQKGHIVASSWPIEDFQDGGCEHNERDVERKSSRGACPIDGEDLISIRS